MTLILSKQNILQSLPVIDNNFSLYCQRILNRHRFETLPAKNIVY